MRNRKVKIFSLVLAGCLSLSGLTVCAGIDMSSANKSSKSEADSAGKEDELSDDMIGWYVSKGYENPSFGLTISLPDTYTLENRTSVELIDADPVESANSESTYDWIRSMVNMSFATVFAAQDEDTYIELTLQNATGLRNASRWDEEKAIAEDSVMTEERLKKILGEDAQITEFQNNVEEITFLGEKQYAAQYIYKYYDIPFYGVTIFLVNEQNPRYMLSIDISGLDLNAVDQASQFFSVYNN